MSLKALATSVCLALSLLSAGARAQLPSTEAAAAAALASEPRAVSAELRRALVDGLAKPQKHALLRLLGGMETLGKLRRIEGDIPSSVAFAARYVCRSSRIEIASGLDLLRLEEQIAVARRALDAFLRDRAGKSLEAWLADFQGRSLSHSRIQVDELLDSLGGEPSEACLKNGPRPRGGEGIK